MGKCIPAWPGKFASDVHGEPVAPVVAEGKLQRGSRGQGVSNLFKDTVMKTSAATVYPRRGMPDTGEQVVATFQAGVCHRL